MKRILVLLLIIISFTACSNEVEKNEGIIESKPLEKTSDIKNIEKINDTDEKKEQKNITMAQSGKDFNSLIPEGWHLLEKVKGDPSKVEGDLNKDKISDIAAVIEKNIKTEAAAPRALIIAFGNPDKTYSISIKADKAILKADEGGVWGDPFESITINNGSILLNSYGGSNWRWYSSYRFRFQDNTWDLIGATLGSYFTATTLRENADVEDYNLLTGDYIIKKSDEAGKITTTKGNRGKKKLVNLKDFNVNSDEKQY